MSNENEDILDEILKALEIKGTKVTIVYEHIHLPGGTDSGSGGGSFGGSLAIGDLVGGSGVVTDVTGSSVTINFPNGVPRGPIELPGVDTTIVVKTSVPPEEAMSSLPPWGIPDDILISTGGEDIVETGDVIDGLHKRFRVPCPGSRLRHVRISDLTILNPSNTSSCSCASIYIASLGADGLPIGGVESQIRLLPGESISEYKAVPGAVAIGIACNANCSGCSGEFTISNLIS
jgi:hypothetical protein